MKELEKAMMSYLTERGWDNQLPCDFAKSISIEAAELLEVFQWNNQSLIEVRKDLSKILQIKAELADVMIYCIDLSVLLGFDTQEIILEKLEQVKKKYPPILLNDRNSNSGTYQLIKKGYRSRQ